MTVSEAKEAIIANYPEKSRYSILCEALDMALDMFKLKEQGLIIELPVPIGTEIYKAWSFNETIIKRPFCCCDIPFFNETIFATKEEAEKRLAELRGE